MLNKSGLVALVGISFSSSRMLIGAFSILYLIKNNITIEQIGLIKAFQAAILLLIDTPLSYVADKYGRKISIIAAILASSIWLFIMGIADNFYSFLFAEFFNAISLGLMSGTFHAYLYHSAVSDGKHADSLLIFSSYQKHQYFAMGFFALIGAVIYQLGDSFVWFLSSFIVFTIAVAAVWMPADNQHKEIKICTFFSFLNDTKKTLLDILQNRPSEALITIIFAILMQILIQYWQVIIEISGANKLSAIGFSFIFSGILIAQSLSGKSLEKIKKINRISKTILFISLSIACSFGLYFNHLAFVLLFLLASFFAISFGNTVFSSLFFSLSPESLRGTYASAIGSATRISIMILFPTVSLIFSFFGINGFVIFYFIIASMLIILVRKNNNL
jgi:hypothetical protein